MKYHSTKPRICTRKGCATPLSEHQKEFCSRRCYKLSGARAHNCERVVLTVRDQWGGLRDLDE